MTISGGGGEGGAADATAGNITSVIQTVLAAQLVAKGGLYARLAKLQFGVEIEPMKN